MDFLLFHRWYFNYQIAEREAAAWVNVTIDVISFSASVHALWSINFSGYKLGVAPSAFAASAVSRCCDTVCFK